VYDQIKFVSGSDVEAMRILETAHQVASQDSSQSRTEALGRIQLAIAAVHWDRYAPLLNDNLEHLASLAVSFTSFLSSDQMELLH
jgi:hypothetical protein